MQTFKRYIAYYALALAALVSVSCDLENILPRRGSRPVVQIVVGDIAVTREGSMQLAPAGFLFNAHDSVIIPEESKVRIGAGQSMLHANEGSFFAIDAPIGSDSGTFVISRGEYFFMARRGAPLAFTFGDIFVRMVDADAGFVVDETGRLAEFFVVRGFAVAERGNTQRLVSACKAVVFDASGVSEDEGVTALRGNALARLEDWVGETVITTAKTEGNCNIEPLTDVYVIREPEPDETHIEEIFIPSPIILEVVDATPRPPRMMPSPSARGATPLPDRLPPPVVTTPPPVAPAEPPPPPPVEREMVMQKATITTTVRRPIVRRNVVSHILGPSRIHTTEEVTFRAVMSEDSVFLDSAVKAYRWIVEKGGDSLEIRTVVPQLLHTFEDLGETFLTLEALGENDTIVSRHKVRFDVRGGQVVIVAGGPYRAETGKFINVLGNARSRYSEIVQYEWFLSSITAPDWTGTENTHVPWVFTVPGTFNIIYRVTLADGSTAADTTTVTVATTGPTANAGGARVVRAREKINLIGTGTSPAGRIVKYEWDCEGNGRFREAKNGRTTCTFREYTHAVLRVTDVAGNTALDTARMVICPMGMVTIRGGNFCIDRNEFPNRPQTHPQTEVTYYEAVAECEKVGKRLCTAEEWRRACRNDEEPLEGVHVFPYGSPFNENLCNTLGNRRGTNRAMMSGAFTGCAGALRINDMSGNVAEWVAGAEGFATAQAFGGFWQSPADSSHCDAYIVLERREQYFHTGFRCCK